MSEAASGASGPQPAAPRRHLLLACLLLAGYVSVLDLANVGLGRADNGDFLRYVGHWVTKPVGFAVPWPERLSETWKRRFFGCAHPLWERQPLGAATAPIAWDAGSANLVWAPSFALSPGDTFSVRRLGVTFGLVRLAALLCLLVAAARALAPRSALWALAVVLPTALGLADPRASSYFNSFYREAATVAYLPLALAGLLAFAAAGRRAAILLFTGGAILVAGTATAHLPLVPLAVLALAALVLWAAPVDAKTASGVAVARWREPTLLLLGTAMLLGLAIFLVRATPAKVRSNVAFQSLFRGALTVSDDAVGDIAFLDLPPEAVAFVGHTAFEPESKAFRAAHPDFVTQQTVVKLLLHRPRIVWRLIVRAADALLDVDQAFEFAVDAACASNPRAAWWTRLKGALRPPATAILALFGLAGAAGIWCARRGRSVHAVCGVALAFAAFAALIEIAAAVSGNGLAYLGRHLETASLFADAAVGLGLMAFLTSRRGARWS